MLQLTMPQSAFLASTNSSILSSSKVRISTQEVAKLLGIDLATLRLLMRKGKIKAPPVTFDSKTNSIGRMWSEDDIEQARKGLQNIQM